MKKFYFNLILFSVITSMNYFAQNLTQFVNPFIGTAGTGHTFPGAVTPFGMVQLSPDTGIEGWDLCSGYRYSDNSIIGFSHTHLSGTGAADYGDVLIMPTVGKLKIVSGTAENPDAGYRSSFFHKNEKASAGYYSVFLDDYKIKVELTATARAGFHKYTFPESKNSNIVIDLKHGISDKTKDAQLKIINNNQIEGYRRSEGWATNQILYFVIEFSKSFESFGIALDDKIYENKRDAKGENVKAYVGYKTNDGEQILVKVGISSVSIENARKNLEAEINHWDFEKTRNETEQLWEKSLGKIKIEGGSIEQKTIFYTALYHALIHPNIYSDVDGRYRGMDNKIHKADGKNHYTVFSLWDTYRALHPLFTIIEPERDVDMIKSLIAKYDAKGILPVWELSSNETGTMIGYHSIPVIADAYLKGLNNFDIEKAFKAMKHSANMNHLGLKSYKELDYVASDREHESVSKTLEYAYDDWCIARMAEKLGKKDDYKKFTKRTLNYKNLFDTYSGFMRGKNANGKWVSPFDPFEVTRDFTEANAWQYSLYVPQDVNGLIDFYGGDENLIKKLDETFNSDSKLGGRVLSDITGMIGQYAHGNEPSHHMSYLYNYTSEPWKTQKTVREIMDKMYSASADGLIGNDDCGQMSAWYVLSAMGFYPVCPGTDQFVIGTPLFDKVIIDNGNNNQFVIQANNPSDKRFYIQSVKLNGKEYDKNYFIYSDIMNGGKVEFKISSEPNKNWGISEESRPYSFSQKYFVSPPFQRNDITYFEKSAVVDLSSRTEGAEIRYTIDGAEPNIKSNLFLKPFEISSTTEIKAIAYKKDLEPSPVSYIVSNKTEYLKAEDVQDVVNGIDYEYYEGKFSSALDLVKRKSVKGGAIKNFDLSSAKIEDHYGFKYSGYINIPEQGSYFFYTQTDDGSILYIDDKQVVGNDGSHAALEASGTVSLKKGFHKIKILYFEDYEGSSIEIKIKGPGIEKQIISDSMLFRKEKIK
jgi:predicted alpha-1,2-mannosidase